MEDSTEVQVSPKKIKKSRWGPVTENDSPIKKDDEESAKIIPNGTGNVSSENPQEENTMKEKQKPIKISKISKSATTGQSKESKQSTKSPQKDSTLAKPIKVEKSPAKPQKEESTPVKVNSPSDSPTSSQLVDNGFHGFESVVLSEQQSKKQDALFRILEKLNALQSKRSEENFAQAGASGSKAVDVEGDSEEGKPDDDMTVDVGHASDSDTDHMEIDMGNDKDNSSRADSLEFSDRQNKAKDSDVDIMDTDSVKSAGKVNKRNRKGVRKSSVTDNKTAKSSILESTLKGSGPGNAKVEYCGGCDEQVDDAEDGICCDGKCERWFHLRCSGLSQAEYEELGRDENAKWACNKCSGKTPSPIKPEGKPLLTVRKDLTKIVTPPPAKRKSVSKETVTKTPKIDISNPAYLKPFDFGWKRELVFRNTSETTRRQGDVYYYTPKGKKLRSLREISDYLEGTDLTQDNFTFWKEPLGMEDPEKEIIRDAKFKALNSKDATGSPGLPKKTTATPKAPKSPKTPIPKLTATVTPLGSPANATVTPATSAQTPASPSPVVPKASASVTPRVVLKGKTSIGPGPKFKATPSKTTTPGQAQKIVISKDKKKKATSDDELEMGMLPPMWEHPKPKDNKLRPMDVCSIRCLPAMGLIPTLQCHVCLCLYHPECVGLEEANHRTIHSYKCKNCQMGKPKQQQPPTSNGAKSILPPPPLTPISSLNTPTPSPSLSPMTPPKLQRISDGKPVSAPRGRLPLTKATSIVGGVTTWLPPSSTIQLRPTPPPLSKLSPSQKPVPPTTTSGPDPANSQPVQTLVSMDCKRYIVVPKHNVLSVSPATTSSMQLTSPVNTHITTTPSDSTNTVSALTPQSYGPGGLILPKPQVTTSTAILVNSSTSSTSSFQNPPGVILLPYITPQTSPTPKEGQQPQYIVVNGPSGLQPGNFIFGNIPQQQPLKLPTVPTSQPAEPTLESAGVKRPLERTEDSPPAKRTKTDAAVPSPVMQNFLQNVNHTYKALLHAFQYLKVQELLRASRVCHMWRDMALHKSLWESVRMKNSHVKDWEGFAGTLRRTGTRHLDLRKMIMPDKPEPLKAMWGDCIKALSKVNSLGRLELCRCVASVLEQIASSCPQLEAVIAVTIKSNQLNLDNFKDCQNLTELKLKSLSGMELSHVSELRNLTKLKQLSLTTVKNIQSVLEVVGQMTQLESLELGEFTSVSPALVKESFSQLTRLRKLRLEKGQQECPTDTILQTISKLPSLIQLELINFDVKAGFDESLGLCTNIKMLLIIPTYVTQSATTNHLVIEGVSKLTKTLNHFTWGLTLELLRVTDLFIDQWEAQKKPADAAAKGPNQPPQKKSSGDSIPILKPTNKDGKKPKDSGVTQVDVLQLPKLHKVLSTILPNTKIVILKVPFSATWRQSICSPTQ